MNRASGRGLVTPGPESCLQAEGREESPAPLLVLMLRGGANLGGRAEI